MAGRLRRDSILGVIFFGGIVLLLYATWVLGDFSLADRFRVQVRFPDARGLKAGDNVLVLGTKLGVVSEVDYDAGDAALPINMTLELDKDVSFKTDYEITIADASLLGGKQISIRPGRGTDAYTQRPLIGKSPPNPIQAIGDLIGGEENSRNLKEILAHFNGILAEFRDGKGTLGEAVVKVRDFFASADTVAKEIGEVVAEAREGRGAVGKIVKSAGDFFEKADGIAETIQNGDGVVTRLIKDKQLGDSVVASVANIETITRDIKEGKGLLGKLVNDNELADKVDDVVDEIHTAAAALNDPEKGFLGAALHDTELRKNVSDTVADIRSIVADARAGKGILGQLLTNETLVPEIEKLIDQVRGAIEDAREAAPVSTFVSLFTGAFQ